MDVCIALIMWRRCRLAKSQSYRFLNSCQSARTDTKQRKLSRRQSAVMATGRTKFEFKYGREDVRENFLLFHVYFWYMKKKVFMYQKCFLLFTYFILFFVLFLVISAVKWILEYFWSSNFNFCFFLSFRKLPPLRFVHQIFNFPFLINLEWRYDFSFIFSTILTLALK